MTQLKDVLQESESSNVIPDRLINAFLLEVLKISNDWLKFAETKNGFIIAIESAYMAFLFKLLSEYICTIASVYIVLISSSFIFAGISFLLALISFFPAQYQILFFKRNKSTIIPANDLSIIHWAHIRQYSSANAYLTEVYARHGKIMLSSQPANLDLATQIYQVCIVANEKYKKFSWSLIFFFSSICIMTFAIILFLGAYIAPLNDIMKR